MDLQGSIELGIRNNGGVGSSAMKHTGRLRAEQLNVGTMAARPGKTASYVLASPSSPVIGVFCCVTFAFWRSCWCSVAAGEPQLQAGFQ